MFRILVLQKIRKKMGKETAKRKKIVALRAARRSDLQVYKCYLIFQKKSVWQIGSVAGKHKE